MTVSPTLISENRFAPAGTSTVTNSPSSSFRVRTRLVWSIASTVPEAVIFSPGISFTCARAAVARTSARTAEKHAAVVRFISSTSLL